MKAYNSKTQCKCWTTSLFFIRPLLVKLLRVSDGLWATAVVILGEWGDQQGITIRNYVNCIPSLNKEGFSNETTGAWDLLAMILIQRVTNHNQSHTVTLAHLPHATMQHNYHIRLGLIYCREPPPMGLRGYRGLRTVKWRAPGTGLLVAVPFFPSHQTPERLAVRHSYMGGS